MSDIVFGNPWHGKTTLSGLVLANSTLKTSMAGTDASGAQKTFYYANPGDNALGHTCYLKVPDLPAPVTPPEISAIGGEFLNDVVLTSYTKRYCPFSGGSGVSPTEWLHYGADGAWRKMSMVISNTGPTTHTVQIWRKAKFGVIGEGLSDPDVLIATLTLTHTAPVTYSYAEFPLLDARYDGRQIVVTRTDRWGGLFDAAPTDGKWDNSTYPAIVAAWRIDIADDASSATATKVWQVEITEQSVIPMPPDNFYSTGPVFATGEPMAWQYWEPFAGRSYVSIGTRHAANRLVGAAYAPDGALVLIEWVYVHVMQPIYFDKTGTQYRGASSTPEPVYPPANTSTGGRGASPNYPHTSVRNDDNQYTYDIVMNGAIVHSLPPTTAWPIYAVGMTNNVFDLKNDTVSFGRFGPDAFDAAQNSDIPRYASFNPRSNTVVTSPTPIGFV